VIFDVHDEYKAAFTLIKEESFTLNPLGIDSLLLPYWLMNSEELESMFIESNEQNSHNQVSQFKHAVILNKEKHNPGLTDITYDTPAYFSLREVCNYIENLNREVIGRLDVENLPKLADGTLIKERKSAYFDKVHSFVSHRLRRIPVQTTGRSTVSSIGSSRASKLNWLTGDCDFYSNPRNPMEHYIRPRTSRKS